VGDPGIHYVLRYVVVAQSLEQDLPAPVELPAEDSMGTMGFIQGATAILDRCAEMLCRVFVLEALDAVAFRASKEKPNHHVVEAPVDEIAHDCSQFRLSTKSFK